MIRKTIDGRDFLFFLPNAEQVSEYLGQEEARISRAVALVILLAEPEDRNFLSMAFERQPGVALELAVQAIDKSIALRSLNQFKQIFAAIGGWDDHQED